VGKSFALGANDLKGVNSSINSLACLYNILMHSPKLIKPAILSLSFLSVLAGAAVSPALGQIRLAFPQASDLTIQMVLSLPPLLVIPVSLLSGRLAMIFRKRQLLFWGLLIYILGGLGGGFANSVPMLLAARALLGIGNGFVAPLSLSLIADFYEGDERANAMGLSSSMATLSGIIMPLISGWLAVYSWRYAFACYLVSLPVCFLIWKFLPEPPKPEKTTGGSIKLPGSVWILGFLTFLLMVVFYLLPTSAALFLQETGIGNSSQSGLVIAAMNVSAFLVGLQFGRIRSKLKSYTHFVGLIALGTGLGVQYFAAGLGTVMLGMFISGLGIGSLMPTLFTETANRVPAHLNSPALSVINSASYLGQFACPIIFTAIAALFQVEDVRFKFLSSAVMALTAALIFLIIALVKGKRVAGSE
jgi:MFS family permease